MLQLVLRNAYLLDNNTCVDDTELLKLLKAVVDAQNNGVVMSENATSSQWVNDWDLAHSMYFISITLTTIGSSVCSFACLAPGWLRGSAVERWSLTGELSLSRTCSVYS